jgi:hypothetical protein
MAPIVNQYPHFAGASDVGLFDDSLPDPPDNVVEWEKLPEDLRERVANQFERGVNHEMECMRDRHERGSKLFAAREVEKAEQHAAFLARKARRERGANRG